VDEPVIVPPEVVVCRDFGKRQPIAPDGEGVRSRCESTTLNSRVLVSQLVATTVKENPPHKGGGSQARTRLARRAVVDAARALFLERGYQATTIDAISDHSDVPTATVYRLFSSKLGILKALLDASIAGDDQALSLHERPQVAALLAEPDPEKLLAGFASITVAINGRSSDVYRILSGASGSDPAAAVLLTDYRQQRDDGQGRIACLLARARALRPGLRERDAADLIHALMSPELYRLLVVDRGWAPKRYEQWLARILADQLTSPPRSPRSARQ
jgi:AcrR family transcriptional regulator